MKTTRLEPPELISGSGTPVSGRNPSTAPRFTTAWPVTRQVTPAARSFANGSRARSAIRKPRMANAGERERRHQDPTSPSSSPITAAIMSDGDSGR